MAEYVLALDQSTTSSRVLVFDSAGVILAQASQQLRQIYPQSGWVEHDPVEIWSWQRGVVERAVEQAGSAHMTSLPTGENHQPARNRLVVGKGLLSCQYTIAIVWQCRRSMPQCKRLMVQGLAPEARSRTGLVINAYFSRTKPQWLFEQIPGLRQRATRGEICFGPVESWLVYQMTCGQLHITDASKAARTMLYDIHKRTWDTTLLEAIQIPREILPEVGVSSHPYGLTNPATMLGAELPVAGIAGDRQDALSGRACFTLGMVKHAYKP